MKHRMCTRAALVAGVVGVITSVWATGARAQTGPDLLIRPFAEGDPFEFYYDSGFTFQGDSGTAASEDYSYHFVETEGRFRLFPEQRAQPRIGWDVAFYDFDSVDPAIPERLLDHSVGFGIGVLSVDGWLGGIAIGVGHAAENTYDDGNGWYGLFDFAIGKQLDETTDIGFVLNYDGNRTILPDFPLIGFQYRKRITNELLMAVGFPTNSIIWTPDDRWLLQVAYTPATNANVDVTYRFTEAISVFGRFDNRVYAFAFDGLEGNDRLFFTQRRLEAGLRFFFAESFNAQLAVGYIIDQEFEVGFSQFNTQTVAEPSDEPYVRFGFELLY